MPGSTFLYALLAVSMISTAHAAQIFSHQGKVPQLIELYTSEGCSSCPPADEYMRTLLNAPDLWQQRIPVAFHVDYWDYIGWKDRFAQPDFSQRQQMMRLIGATSGVYTPGWLVDGREWRGFFKRQALPAPPVRNGGKLQVTLENGIADIHYKPVTANTRFNVHMVQMQFDQQSEVKAGENHGSLLKHEFVALSLQQASGDGHWQFALSAPVEGRQALAVWVTASDNNQPLQATGGWLQ